MRTVCEVFQVRADWAAPNDDAELDDDDVEFEDDSAPLDVAVADRGNRAEFARLAWRETENRRRC